MCKSSLVSIFEVARNAGVSISTVSRVINGKAKPFRISPTTQARVLAVARQLGYQPDPIARNIALGKGAPARPKREIPEPKSAPETVAPAKRQIGLLLSATSPASSLGVIPALEPTVAEAGYELVVITLPADTAAARKRVSVFWQDGMAGLLCCPTLYQTVLTMVSETVPAGTPESWRKRVIVLWQGAGQALLLALKTGPGETEDRTITPQANLPAPSSGLTNQQLSNPATSGFPLTAPPPVVVAAVPSGTDPEPVPTVTPTPEPAMNPELNMTPIPVSAPELAVDPTPVSTLNNQQPDNPTTSPSPAPAPESIPIPAVAEPVIVEASAPLPKPAVENAQELVPVSEPSISEPEVEEPEPAGNWGRTCFLDFVQLSARFDPM